MNHQNAAKDSNTMTTTAIIPAELQQLGAQAHGHYKAAEKHQEKAEQQLVSAGLYLKEAQKLLRRQKDMNFAEFLLKHCPIGKSRAYEIIAIADGRKTVEEIREAGAARQAAKRQRDANVRDVTDKPQRSAQRSAQSKLDTDSLKPLRADVIRLIKAASEEQLTLIQGMLKIYDG